MENSYSKRKQSYSTLSGYKDSIVTKTTATSASALNNTGHKINSYCYGGVNMKPYTKNTLLDRSIKLN